MQKTGITRRIDELGRIVVPKEIRYNLGIRDGEPLEIFVEDNGILIKKYSKIDNVKDITKNYVDIISDVTGINILVSDREKIIVTSNNLKDKIDLKLGDNHKILIDERLSYVSEKKEVMFDIEGYFTIMPIITSVDSLGIIIFITNEKEDVINYLKILNKLILNKVDI